MEMLQRNFNAETRGRRDAEVLDANLFDNKITASVIDAAIEVHRILGGPGLLESIYEEALAHELELRNISVQRQIAVPVLYKGVPIRDALRLDLLVENRIIIEVKATESTSKVHAAQLLTYLRLSKRKLGLVLNFGLPLLRSGISRVVNEL